jgi:ATP-dependent RNA helicase DeaD
MTSAETDATTGFAGLGLDPKLLAALAELGYEEPTPIQREAIPPLLAGHDVVGQAATGTGKTAAFALPLLQRVLLRRKEKVKGPHALVLAPTRELAIQVAEAVHRYGHALGVSVLPIYGGQAYEQQLRGLKRGADVLVATPGRMIDHVQSKAADLSRISTVVLDEADEMLDMGFLEDIETLLGATPPERQVALISATLPPRVTGIAKRHLKDPVHVKIAAAKLAPGDLPKIRQSVYYVPRARKAAALSRLLDLAGQTSGIVFCRTRTEVDDLVLKLGSQGLRVEALHGGMSQTQREKVLQRLRQGQADLVVATDVAARGLDIDRLTHVINFDVPSAPEAYVHRIGRVGRAGREGVAITLCEPRERRLISNIEHVTKQKIAVASLPTVADLRAHRLELLRAALRETLAEGGLDRYRDTVVTLADEGVDPLDIAMAAVKLAYRPDRDGEEDPSEFSAAERAAVPMTRIYVGAGRMAGIRPQDLVGAIAGEAGIDGRDIGAIQIADRFALVELREDVSERVIAALSQTTLKGKRVQVRPDDGRGEPMRGDRFDRRPGPPSGPRRGPPPRGRGPRR